MSRVLALGLSLLFAGLAVAEEGTGPRLPLTGETQVEFANVAAGRKVLTTRDAHVERLSPFDRQARLYTDRAVDEAEYLKFVGEQVSEWKDAERETISMVVKKVGPRLARWKLPLPRTVVLIRTTGREEGRAAYTRGDAIVLPANILARDAAHLEDLFTHELFHVLSRRDGALRDRMYAIVGFKKIGEVEWPKDLLSRRLTNPDAPVIEHAVRVMATLDGKEEAVHAMPILFASAERYDAKKGGEFFKYLTFRLLVVEQRGGKWQPVVTQEGARLLDPEKTPSYLDQLGRNTSYIIHPEEALADNFMYLVKGKRDVKTPRVLEELDRVLRGEKAKQ